MLVFVMQLLAALLIGHPWRIFLVGATFLAAGFGLRAKSGALPPRAVLVTAALWFLYAGWEWLVVLRTPDADIRVDLLVMWPTLAVASLWAIYRLVR